jgi:uncharacterized protein YbbC (DUF1343 family)
MLVLAIFTICHARQGKTQSHDPQKLIMIDSDEIITGAERTSLYYPALQGRKIGVVCNHSSMIGRKHLVDSLIRAGFTINAIFSPEHGFKGDAEAGAGLTDGKDARTGIRIISLYGKKKKPDAADLENIDLLLFDIQDVGVRFYTYISTLSGIMEEAAKAGIPLIVLDRPNPNGFYIDGPVLDTNFRSFVGMHPVPVVYGLTIGEYSLMINGEEWAGKKKCTLEVIPLKGYDHNMLVKLDSSPSPNLPDWQSIYLYPSVCLFEGTFISVGRGTDKPFRIIGHPQYLAGSFIFTPESITGISENPPYNGRPCQGLDLTAYATNYQENTHHFNISWLLSMHEYFHDSTDFFNTYFDKLAGNQIFRSAIMDGKSEEQIRQSWQEDLVKYSLIRRKYLIYPD